MYDPLFNFTLNTEYRFSVNTESMYSGNFYIEYGIH